VQSTEGNAFAPADVPVFQTMADQLAVAIENVRLLEDARRNLRDIEALNRQLTGEAWINYVAGRKGEQAGYKADIRGVHLVYDQPSDDEKVTKLPIEVRGQKIGSLEIAQKDDNGELSEDVRAILEAVSERVALALDNTRLSQQAQRTAQRQQLINAFSEKLQRTNDVGAILEAVATEMSLMLGTPRTFVQLETRGEVESDV
jgi:GAF domain-containing protein